MAANGFTASPIAAGSFSSGNAGANSIFLTKVTVIRAAAVTAVLHDIPSAVSGIQYKALIYDSAHSVLLGNSAIVSSLVAGYNRIALTAPLALSAGDYYVGYVCDTGISVSTAFSGASWFVSGGQSVSAPANPLTSGASNSTMIAVSLEFNSGAAAYGFAPDYTTGVTLGGGNTTATTTATANMAARSVVTQSAVGGGKYYAEVAISGPPGLIGVTSANSAMATPNPSNTFSQLLNSGGVANGSGGSSINTGLVGFVSGDVIGVAYDASAGKVWFNRNNGAWGGNGLGDPVAGTNGLVLGAGAWPVMVEVFGNTTAATFTLRDRNAALQYAKPSGYSAWSAAAAAPPSRPIITMVQ